MAAKKALRTVLRRRRRARSPEEQSELADLFARVLLEMPVVRAARCVAGFASLPGEPGTGPARITLRARGVRVLLPVVLGAGDRSALDLDWAQDTGTTAAPQGMGGGEPEGPRLGRGAIADADVVLTPGLAIDGWGRRLGNGGGCYDRALRRVAPSALILAMVHDDELFTDRQLPAEEHDVPVHAVLTPTRWIFFSRPDAGSGSAPPPPAPPAR